MLWNEMDEKEIRKLARKYIKNEDDLNDAVQDIYVKLLSAENKEIQPSKRREYIKSVIKNSCINQIKKNSDENIKCISNYNDIEHLLDGESFIEAAELKIDIELIEETINKLNPIEITILRLRYKDNMTFSDIANYMDETSRGPKYTEGSVRQTYNRSIDKIKAKHCYK